MVQVFLPYPDFEKSIRTLNKKHLTKQLVECIQLLSIIVHNKKGYANHPVTKMWRNYARSLHKYAEICCRVIAEKYPTYNLKKMQDRLNSAEFGGPVGDSVVEDPWFLGNLEFHDSHKSSLWHKNREEYHIFEQYNYIKCYAWPVPVKKVTFWK
jgi:hypothetical protein